MAGIQAVSRVSADGPVTERAGDPASGAAIAVQGMSKLYPVFGSVWQGLRFLVRAAAGDAGFVRRIRHVAALDGVSFTVRSGERVGVIGRNGSGKSTLLKILAGALMPTAGTVHAPDGVFLLEGDTVAFDAEASARENARKFLARFIDDRRHAAACLKDIEDFVDLGAYFDQPVKYYSLGMKARAEFATATAVESPVVLVDEVLGAGDMFWAERCARRVERFCEQGRSVVLVSHSMDQVLRYCERVIWLDCGRVVMDGHAEEVVRRYEGYLERLTWLGDDVDDKSFNWESERDAYEDVALPESGNSVSRWPGLGGVQVTGLWINGATELACELDPDQPLRLRLALRARRAGKYSLRYLFTFWNSRGKRLGVAENERHRMSLQVGTRFEVETEIAPRVFSQGIYLLSISVLSLPEAGSAANEGSVRQDVIYKSARIVMTSAQPLTGPEVTYHVPMQVELT